MISQSPSEPTGGWTTPSASPGHGRSCFQTEETGGNPSSFGKGPILVGWFSQPMWRVCNRQNGFIFFNFRGEKRTYLKSPTSYRWRFQRDRFETTKRSGPEISWNFRKLRKLKTLEVDKSQVLSESWASPQIDASEKMVAGNVELSVLKFSERSGVTSLQYAERGALVFLNDRKLPKS